MPSESETGSDSVAGGGGDAPQHLSEDHNRQKNILDELCQEVPSYRMPDR